MIRINNLNKYFNNIQVLKNINLEIKEGEVVVIIGASGSGKSTLLRCINRLEEPTSGEIFFKNKLITSDNILDVRKKIGMVFQNFNLFPHISVLGNLIIAPKLLGCNKLRKLYLSLKNLKKVGLLDRWKDYPNSLSGGQKQRVAIARTLVSEPEVILFDEPTSALDPESVKGVLNLIKGITKNKKLTSIIVTHEMGFAKEIADRVIFMSDGKIIEKGKPSDIFSKPKSSELKKFLSSIL